MLHQLIQGDCGDRVAAARPRRRAAAPAAAAASRASPAAATADKANSLGGRSPQHRSRSLRPAGTAPDRADHVEADLHQLGVGHRESRLSRNAASMRSASGRLRVVKQRTRRFRRREAARHRSQTNQPSRPRSPAPAIPSRTGRHISRARVRAGGAGGSGVRIGSFGKAVLSLSPKAINGRFPSDARCKGGSIRTN